MQPASLGQRIRELRIKNGMTQIELAKSLCTPSMISQIESDRARPSYKILSGLAERLCVPLEKLLSDTDLYLDTISRYRMARAMLASKEFAAALPLFRGLLDTSHGHLSHREILHDLGTCYLKTNQLAEADQTFEQLQALAVLQHDHHLAARALWNAGVLDLQRKKNQLALYKLEKALRETTALPEPDPLLTGKILFDLGRAQTLCGEPDKALKSYEQASMQMQAASNWRDLALLYLQMSKSYKLLGEFEKAISYSDRATALFDGTQNLVSKLKVDCETAALLSKTGEARRAIETLQDAIPKFLEYGEQEEAGTVSLLLATLQLEASDLQDAEHSCAQANSLLSDSPFHRGQVLYLAGKIARKQTDAAKAIHCLEKAAEYLKDANIFSEWEAVVHDLARVYHEAGEAKRAFHLMDEAHKMARQEMRHRGISL